MGLEFCCVEFSLLPLTLLISEVLSYSCWNMNPALGNRKSKLQLCSATQSRDIYVNKPACNSKQAGRDIGWQNDPGLWSEFLCPSSYREFSHHLVDITIIWHLLCRYSKMQWNREKTVLNVCTSHSEDWVCVLMMEFAFRCRILYAFFRNPIRWWCISSRRCL